MTQNHKEAFTRLELLVVIGVIVILGLVLIPGFRGAHWNSQRITCVNHLKEIGTADRIWANDLGKPPVPAVPQADAIAYSWMSCTGMSNELGQNPLILVCPADERKPASTSGNHIANTNISYFMAIDANDTQPQSILAGDRNLGPGTISDSQYGFSPADGKGNDVVFKGPVCWSLKMHSLGNPTGAGNILLGDGSAQQVTSAGLNANWLKSDGLAATNAASVRLIFP